MKVDPDPLVPDTYVRAHKRVIIYQTKWGPKARAWPKPSTKKPSPGTLWRRLEFGMIAAATKNVHPLDYATAVELVKGTEYVPRDVLMKAMYGTLYEIHLTDGSVWNGWRLTVPNVQDVLEQLTSVPGSIVVRGTTFWEVVEPGDNGDVFKITNGVPGWVPRETPPAPPQGNFRAVMTADQVMTINANNKLVLNSAPVNTGGFFDTTNKRFVPPAGTIMLTAGIVATTWNTADLSTLKIVKNGNAAVAITQAVVYPAGGFGVAQVACVDQANGTSDYYELYVLCGAHAMTINSVGLNTFLQGIVW